MCSAHSQTPTTGRRLEYLLWRAERDQRLRKSFLCTQAGGVFAGPAVHAGSAIEYSAVRRRSEDEHLQQALPGADGSISVAISSHHTGGDGAASKLGAVPHLQDVILEQSNAGSARGDQPFQTDPGAAR